MSFQPFLGFAPDLDYDTPGAFSDCQHIVPTPRGMRVQPGWEPEVAVNTTLPTGGANRYVVGFTDAPELAPSPEVYQFAGTQTQLFRRAGAGWTFGSTVAAFSNVVAWTFAPFGGYMLAAGGSPYSSGNTTVHAAALSFGYFAPVTGAPRTAIVIAASRFAMAFGDQDYADRWRCSARDDHTSWTASLSTLAATGRIVEPAGGFTAAIEFGGDVIAFKHRSMHIGRFTGAPEVWAWQKFPQDAGCIGPRAVCKMRSSIAFMSPDNIYVFDGASLRGLLDGKAKEWWGAQSSALILGGATLSMHFVEKSNQLWVQFQRGTDTTAIMRWLVIDMDSGRMGLAQYCGDTLCLSQGRAKYSPVRLYGFLRANALATDRQFARIDTAGDLGYSWFDSADFTYARDSAEEAPYFVMPELGDGMSEVELTELRHKSMLYRKIDRVRCSFW